MKKLGYFVIFSIFMITSLKADKPVEMRDYKDIKDYKLVATFDRDIKEQTAYGIFLLILSEDVYSVNTSQLLLPKGTEISCGYDRSIFFGGVITKPKCSGFKFNIGDYHVDGTVANILVTAENGNEKIGPNIQKGHIVTVNFDKITNIAVSSVAPSTSK